MDSRDLLTAAAGHAADFLDGLPERRVGPAETDPRRCAPRWAARCPTGPRMRARSSTRWWRAPTPA